MRKIYKGADVDKKVDEYKGLDNRDLKLIAMEEWNIPRPLRNHKVLDIMEKIGKMEPGEMVKGTAVSREEAKLLRSAVYRLIKRHELGVTVVLRGKDLYLKMGDGE